MSKKTNLAIKIILPVAIAATITSIFVFRQKEKEKLNEVTSAAVKTGESSHIETAQKELPENLKDANFNFTETKKIELADYTKYNLPIILDYGSESCAPCRVMKPAIKKAHNDYYGKAFIKYSDVWANPDTASGYPIQVIPTQIFYGKDGKPFVPSDKFGKEAKGFFTIKDKNTNEVIYSVHQGILNYNQIAQLLEEMGVS